MAVVVMSGVRILRAAHLSSSTIEMTGRASRSVVRE